MITRSTSVASYHKAQLDPNKKLTSEKKESADLKTSDSIAMDKVARLKELIAKGEYKIDLEATSRKMAQELLG